MAHCLAVALLCMAGRHPLAAQAEPADTLTLDAFLIEALAANPRVVAATHRARATRSDALARGALPDPRLMVGVMNVPVAAPGFGDMMTMKQVGIAQQIPFPGKLGLARRAAEQLATAGAAAARGARVEVTRAATEHWASLGSIDAQLEILRRRRDLLATIRDVIESGYGNGTVGQDAVWRSRVELSRIALDATALMQRRESEVAALNALRDRPADMAIGPIAMPPAMLHAALADRDTLQFAGDSLGAALLDTTLPSVATLLEWAAESSPVIAAHLARIASQSARVDLAGKASQPDLDVSLQYDQRDNRSDFISVSVAIPLAIRAGRVQDRRAESESLELDARHAEHAQMLDDFAARLTADRAAAVAARTKLAILDRVILPEGRAALDASRAGLAAGRTSFVAVLDAEDALFRDETMHAESLADFIIAIANIEAVVGREILP